VDWRHGTDGLPGTPGTEEHRLGHLAPWRPRSASWAAADDLGVGLPTDANDKTELGWSNAIPSLFIGPSATNVSGHEPNVWGTWNATDWQDDVGVDTTASPLFSATADGITANTVTLSTATWSANRWIGLYVTMTSGTQAGQERRITSSNANTLTIAQPWTGAPALGDFEIYAKVGVNDLVPTVFLRPDGTGTPENNTETWVAYSGAVTSAGSNTLTDSTAATWVNGAWNGGVVYIDAGTGRGQVRTISDTIGAPTCRLDLATDWTIQPDTTSSYRIEYMDNFLDSKFRPDRLRGDDRAYRSVAEILPVIEGALTADGCAAPTTAAGILYNSFNDFLCTSSPSADAEEFASVNDWATDGLDNNGSGVADEFEEAMYEDALTPNDWLTDGMDNDGDGFTDAADTVSVGDGITETSHQADKRAEFRRLMYERLGLKEWAHADAASIDTRVQQAAQVVASIVDFRDADHRPMTVTDADLGEEAATGYTGGAFTVYGAEGLHVTEVMASTGPVFSADGSECWDDGQGAGTNLADTVSWDWVPGDVAWVRYDGAGPGKFTFSGLPDGWYALLFIGSNGRTFNVTAGATTGTVTPSYNDPAHGTDSGGVPYDYGFVREAGGQLKAFQVSGNALTIDVDTSDAMSPGKFRGIALLPQYIEITNIAAQNIALDNYQITTDQGVLTIPAGAVIGGASSDGVFPINYGTFVIAMCEAAYDNQWGSNKTGTWGDDTGEAYTIWFAGDVDDAGAQALMLDLTNPSVTVQDAAGELVAGGDVDGAINGAALQEFGSQEKTSPLSRAWNTHVSAAGNNFVSSQMRAARDSGSVLYAPAIYTNLNSRYSELWTDAATAAFDTAANLSGAQETLPIILNRPYPSAGWLGLVPLGNISGLEWHTIDFDRSPVAPPNDMQARANASELLGLLMSRAVTGGAYCRINMNTAGEETIATIFNDTDTNNIVNTWRPADGWFNWDHLLDDTNMQSLADTATIEDSGAGTYADDFVDDSDEAEEWARRYGALIDLKSTGYKYVVAGLVFEENAEAGDAPIAQVRIEAEFVLDGTQLRVNHFRYLTE